MFRIKSHSLNALFLCGILLLVSCGAGLSSGVTSSAGTGDTASDADTLSDGETGLFDNGPIDLPVTIAKLESPNAPFIELTVDEASSSPQLKTTNALRQLTADTNYTCHFEGSGSATDASARAITDPTTTPYVLLYVPDTELTVIEDVASDGSFSADIACEIEQNVTVSALTAGELSSATSSPAVIFVVDELGTVTVSITNSDQINDAQPFGADPQGNVIFSVTNDDSSYTLWRRNLDGTLPDTLLENHDSQPIAVEAVSELEVSDDTPPSIVLADREVDLTLIQESTDDVFASSVLDSAIGIIDDDEDNGETKSYAILPIASDKVLVTHKNEDGNTRLLDMYRLDDSSVSSVISATPDGQPSSFASLLVAYTDLTETYVAVRRDGIETTNIFTIDIAVDGPEDEGIYETAWSARQTVILNLPYRVHSLNPTENRLFVLVQDPSTEDYEVGVIDQGVYTSLINLSLSGITPYPGLMVDEEGALGVVCDEGGAGRDPAFSLLTLAETQEIVPLATPSKLRSCNHWRPTLLSTTNHRLLHFFTADEADSSAQMSFIDLTTNAIVNEYTE